MTKKKDEPTGEPSLEALEAELERRRNLPQAGLGTAVVGRACRDLPSSAHAVSAGLDKRDHRVVVGERLTKPVVRGDLRFAFPFHSWDAWMVLHHIAREPLEHNRDGTIPARWIKPLEGRLVALPSWCGIDCSAASRVPPALQVLADLGLLASRKGPTPETPNLRIAGEGTKALKDGRAAFFERSLDFRWLAPFDPRKECMRPVCKERIDICCWRMGREPDEFEGLARRLSLRVLGVLPREGAVRWDDMDEAFAPNDPHVFSNDVPWSARKVELSAEEFFDRIDPAKAMSLLVESLLYPYSFGLVGRGVTIQGELTMSLTDAGRAWLGLPPVRESPPPRHVKVTPAFDIFFGRVDPSALAEVSLYATLSGHDHGMVGKLDRRSVHGATALGISVTEIVTSLEELVASPLPANVRQTLEDWERQAQPVQVREGVVLRCPDASTAGTLERLAKGSAERLSDTILLLPDRRSFTSLRKKAGEMGILL